jgi:hypothetical protein
VGIFLQRLWKLLFAKILGGCCHRHGAQLTWHMPHLQVESDHDTPSIKLLLLSHGDRFKNSPDPRTEGLHSLLLQR